MCLAFSELNFYRKNILVITAFPSENYRNVNMCVT